MSTRVLSTDEAKATIQDLKRVINGDLTQQVRVVQRDGDTLQKPDVWDGNLATKFRETWTQTHKVLDQMLSELDKLRSEVELINQDIMTAGGNN